MKRTASKQLTKDNQDDDESDANATAAAQSASTIASAEELSKRTILKVKRRNQTASSSSAPGSFPRFDFGFPGQKSGPESKATSEKEVEPQKTSQPEKKPEPEKVAMENKPEPKVEANAFAALKPKHPTYECASCSLANKLDAEKCAACEAANPHHQKCSENKEAPKSSAPTFSFGFNTNSSSEMPTFGKVAESASGATTAALASGCLKFDDASSLTVQPTESKFKESKAEPTGEENDEILLRIQCKVYVLRSVKSVAGTSTDVSAASEKNEKKEESSKDVKSSQGDVQNKYVEAGSGELHINGFVQDGSTKWRMVLREERTKRLVLNAPIFPKMSFNIQSEKYVRLLTFDLQNVLAVHLLKFRSKADAEIVYGQIHKLLNVK